MAQLVVMTVLTVKNHQEQVHIILMTDGVTTSTWRDKYIPVKLYAVSVVDLLLFPFSFTVTLSGNSSTNSTTI